MLKDAPDPIGILLQIASDDKVETSLRVHAASQAAPYVHPRLSAAIVDATTRVEVTSPERIVERLNARLARLVAPSEKPAADLIEALAEPSGADT